VDAVAHVTNALLRTVKSCGPDAPDAGVKLLGS